MASPSIVALLRDPNARLTPSTYQAALLDLESCRLETYGVNHKCAARERLHVAKREHPSDPKELAKVALRHLAHPSAPVRFQALEDAVGLNAANGQGPWQELRARAAASVVPLMPAERDPIVLALQSEVVESQRGSRRAPRWPLSQLEQPPDLP